MKLYVTTHPDEAQLSRDEPQVEQLRTGVDVHARRRSGK
jgi:hypothetical protein